MTSALLPADMIPAPIPLEQALALRAEKEAALAAPPLAATLDDGEDRPSVHAPKPRGATEKAYTALERPGQQPFFLPNAAIVNARRAKVGSGQGGASGAAMTDASDSETGSGPAAPKPAPRVRKASSPRPPKESVLYPHPRCCSSGLTALLLLDLQFQHVQEAGATAVDAQLSPDTGAQVGPARCSDRGGQRGGQQSSSADGQASRANAGRHRDGLSDAPCAGVLHP